MYESFLPFEGAVKYDHIMRGLSADGSRLASISDGTVQLWDMAAAEKMGTFRAENEMMIIGVSSEGRMIATFGAD